MLSNGGPHPVGSDPPLYGPYPIYPQVSWFPISHIGELSNNGKSPIFNGKIHYKWPFSIAMLVYQRVKPHWLEIYLPGSSALVDLFCRTFVFLASGSIELWAWSWNRHVHFQWAKTPGTGMEEVGIGHDPNICLSDCWSAQDELLGQHPKLLT